MMDQLYRCACNDDREVLLYLDPMHQIHNNENDYAWQPTGLAGTKKVLANTGRKRLNIIGAAEGNEPCKDGGSNAWPGC